MEMKEGFATYYSVGDFIKNKKPLCTKNIICDIAIWNAMFEHIPLEIRENGKLVKYERCKHGVHSLLDPDNKEIFIRSMRGLGGNKVVEVQQCLWNTDKDHAMKVIEETYFKSFKMLANNVLLSEDLEEGFTDFSCFGEFKKNLTIRSASRDEKFHCVKMFD